MRDEYPPFRLDNGSHEPGRQARPDLEENPVADTGPDDTDKDR
jgi:hypothetical protein